MEQISKRLFNWASILEAGSREQALKTASMPFVYPHVALMPDAHQGKGATVGSVIPTSGAIIPAAVGVDIGCGMIAVRTQFAAADLAGRPLISLREAIEQVIPLSAGVYNTAIYGERTEQRIAELEAVKGADQAEAIAGNWRLQLGTLGSGNHFIEVSLDEQDRVWLFLHSGSRGVGNRLAGKHIKIAQKLCEHWWIPLPDPDLAYLVEDTPEFWAYIRDLRWAQHFALLNRAEMMDRVADCLSRWLGEPAVSQETIQCHHNYTEEMPAALLKRWRPDRKSAHVWLSRKGAIDATEGKPGLIPGSMGAASYVVTGKGNPLSLYSSPHGAGRNFSRSAARKAFTRDQLDAAMEGIEWRHTDAFLDEIPAAYKPIDQVMADAADLVEIRHTLRQIVNVKGDLAAVTSAMPPAEVDVTPDLVRMLLAEQHPDLAGLPLEVMANGWDNVMLRLGDDLIVRVPRRELAIRFLVNEQRWLPALTGRLPLPIPAPVRIGRPSGEYPWPWSIVPFRPGEPAAVTPPADLTEAARSLGAFLNALHVPGPQRPPAGDGPDNPVRGVPLDARAAAVAANMDALGDEIDRDRVQHLWDAARSVPHWDGPPLWIHGDLHPANILVHEGRISAVIDFGDLTTGDPATDLSAAWMLFDDPAHRDVFWQAYGPTATDYVKHRAFGWALALSLVMQAHSADNPLMHAVGARTYRTLLAT